MSQYPTDARYLKTNLVGRCALYPMGFEALRLRDICHRGCGPTPVLNTDAWRAFLEEENLSMGGPLDRRNTDRP